MYANVEADFARGLLTEFERDVIYANRVGCVIHVDGFCTTHAPLGVTCDSAFDFEFSRGPLVKRLPERCEFCGLTARDCDCPWYV